MADDRGQITPLFAVMFLLMVGVVTALGRLGTVVVLQARAQAAADAAALAGAAGGHDAADALAAANHGLVVAYREHGAQVQVQVRVGSRVGTATAELVAADDPAPGIAEGR